MADKKFSTNFKCLIIISHFDEMTKLIQKKKLKVLSGITYNIVLIFLLQNDHLKREFSNTKSLSRQIRMV